MILLYVTCLHKTSLMSQFLHVEFNVPFCTVQSALCNVSYVILKTAKTSNLKAHNNEKMDFKEKETNLNII